MISNKKISEIKEKLNQLKIKKIDYQTFNAEKFLLNPKSYRSDLEMNHPIYKTTRAILQDDYDYYYKNSIYENVNQTYDLNLDLSKEKIFEYECYLLENEFFGYDSSNIDVLKKETGKINSYELSKQFKNFSGLYQSLIFLKKDGEKELVHFEVFYSKYCDFVYGKNTFEAQDFQKQITQLIKEIFGNNIINFRIIPTINNPEISNFSRMKNFVENKLIEDNSFFKNSNSSTDLWQIFVGNPNRFLPYKNDMIFDKMSPFFSTRRLDNSRTFLFDKKTTNNFFKELDYYEDNINCIYYSDQHYCLENFLHYFIKTRYSNIDGYTKLKGNVGFIWEQKNFVILNFVFFSVKIDESNYCYPSSFFEHNKFNQFIENIWKNEFKLKNQDLLSFNLIKLIPYKRKKFKKW